MKSSSGFYSSRIDHLRLYAAMFVIWWHYASNISVPRLFEYKKLAFFSLFDEGHVGVGLFFTLSGYLFYYINMNKNIDYKGFIVNRILRIFPLFMFWSLLLFYLLPNLSLVDFVLATVTAIDRGSLPGVGWSIAVEFQFYLLFPFICIFIARYGIKYVFLALLLMITLRSMQILYAVPLKQISYTTMYGRLDQFLLGMMAAYYAVRISSKIIPLLSLIAGFLIAVYSAHYLNLQGGLNAIEPSNPVWIWFHSVQGLGWALLTLGYCMVRIPPIPYLGRVLGAADTALAKVGELTYSIYWCHLPVLAVVRGLSVYGLPTMPAATHAAINIYVFVALPMIILFAWLTYQVIEKPFLELRRKYIVAT